jgi:CheY-like chemotaxis protein
MLFSKPKSPPIPVPAPGHPGMTSASPAPALAPGSKAAEPRGVILLVDDSAMIRMAVGKTLTANQYGIIEADSGLTGLEQWKQHQSQIKLVLSDVFMPGMDGMTFARELRRQNRTLPIILMSSKLDDDSRWVAEEAGFRLLPKPFKDELLLELINRMLRLAYPR